MVYSRKPPRLPSQVEGRYSRVHANVVNKPRAKSPTQEFEHQAPTQVRDAPIGTDWYRQMIWENLWRSFMLVCALRSERLLGRAEGEIMSSRTSTRPHCEHRSVARYPDVGVCTACFTAVDRMV